MTVEYVSKFTTPLRDKADGGRRIATLLWGDTVHVPDGQPVPASGPIQVRAREWDGWVDAAALGGQSLLELYIIDVGQGDGVLFKTPDGKWHLIDAGIANRSQMTKKGAANFIRWKFQDDLIQPTVSLANVLMSHADFDHYGGFLDLLAGKLFDGRTFPVEVENFYHNGMARFKDSPKLGAMVSAEVAPFPHGSHGIGRKGKFITELLDGKDSFANPPREFEDSFAELAALVGTVPANVCRISHMDQHLSGYGPGENDVTLHVLGPVLEHLTNGQAGLRSLNGDSKTRNGHSLLLRLDYGKARILLTGDLNSRSQQLLLSYYPPQEFAADVAKSCHHGSEDMDLDFMRAQQARATVISSGDNEDYSHPRPLVMGVAGRHGREALGADGEVMPPLVYSTELARSVLLAYASSVRVNLEGGGWENAKTVRPWDTQIRPQVSKGKYRWLRYLPLATDLVYGLVNVRTDGEQVLCATMEEKGNDFDFKVFRAGVDV